MLVYIVPRINTIKRASTVLCVGRVLYIYIHIYYKHIQIRNSKYQTLGTNTNRSHIKNNKKLLRYKKTQTKAKQTTEQKGRGYGTLFGKSPSARDGSRGAVCCAGRDKLYIYSYKRGDTSRIMNRNLIVPI